MRGVGVAVLSVVLALSGLAGHPRAATATGLVVQTLGESGLTKEALAQSLVGGGLTVRNVTFSGTNSAAGRYTGGSTIIGFESGVILSTGRAKTFCNWDPDLGECIYEKGVEGPNDSDSSSTDHGAPGDLDLANLAQYQTYDAAVLEFDFVPVASSVTFQYVFASEEYNEWANTEYNDVFAFYVNGTNCALVPNTSDPVSVNTINGGNPYGTGAVNPQYFRNNELMYDPNTGATTSPIDTEMDGLTTVLTCTAYVNATETNHLKLAIADASDGAWDANVFIQAGSFKSPCQTAPFTDVQTTHPFCGEIKWMKDSNISTGYQDGTYRPGLSVTRQAMSAFIARLAGATLTPCLEQPFSDVPVTHPFCKEIQWMKQNNISTGYGDGTYRPTLVVTRQSMSAFMARVAGASPSSCSAAPFTDVPTSHPFCKEIKWMAETGISTGFSDGSFKPTAEVTRQAMSAFMFRVWVLMNETA